MSTSSKETPLKDITSFLGLVKSENDDNSRSQVKGMRHNISYDAEGRFLCGDLNIHIDREGTWFYHGTPIGRKELVKLFSKVIHRDDEGIYWLITPAEKGRILVEDAPFMAVEMTVMDDGGDQRLEFRTNVDDFVVAGPTHPLRFAENPETGEPAPYILVRKNLEAKLTRNVFYQLVDLGEERSTLEEITLGVWSDGEFFEIGRLEALGE